MTMPDLIAEHARLMAEAAEIRRLVTVEWTEMSAQTAQYRNRRLLEIADRLAAIEHTKAWRGRDVS